MRFTSDFDPSLVSELANLYVGINPVEIATPTNFVEAKTSFMDTWRATGTFENPVFLYDETLLDTVLENARKIRVLWSKIEPTLILRGEADHKVHVIMTRRLASLDAISVFAYGIKNHNDRLSGDALSTLYRQPIASDFNVADSLLRRPYSDSIPPELLSTFFTREEQRKLRSLHFNSRDIAKYFNLSLDYLHIKGWKTEVSSRFSAIDVRDFDSVGSSLICIPESRSVNGLKLLELIGHEINSHLRSSVNTRAFFTELLGADSPLLPLVPILSKSADELFYEGVAKLSDIKISGSTGIPKPYTVLAIRKIRAEQANFSEIASFIYDLVTDKNISKSPKTPESAASMAWGITYRLFRGSTSPDVPNSYVFPKDSAYLSGLFFVLRRHEEIPPHFYDYSTLTLDDLNALAPPARPKYDGSGLIKHVSSILLS